MLKIAASVSGNINIFYPGLVTLLSIKLHNNDFDLFIITEKNSIMTNLNYLKNIQ